jgi:transcription initiation factor TFIID TATA-box-binding protein
MMLHEAIKLKPLLKLDNVTQPDRFPGIVLRHQLPKSASSEKPHQVTFLIFEAGKVVCVRARSREELEKASATLLSLLRRLGVLRGTRKAEVEVVNIVATVTMSGWIDLEGCASSLSPVYYEPTIFPGVIYRVEEPVKASFLLFASGKVVCAGTKRESDLELACQHLERVLTQHRPRLLYT